VFVIVADMVHLLQLTSVTFLFWQFFQARILITIYKKEGDTSSSSRLYTVKGSVH